ncbi:hypothetical protein CDD81_8141 [Ophiocordyceps australis]|uniref:Peptidase A1 domain-containing protein n=1 Tax=Ophiocordyceps australis TaxID=1399860 RepID=A0A2C5Y1S7_9HYPO|nr:hypothetical protein CDD81_8141 [Ophiocordyceps australis]
MLTVDIGTPPQKIYAQLDTGSFELWINPDCGNVNVLDRQFCHSVGHYQPSRSSTAVVSNKVNMLRYGIGAANITYVLDHVSLPGAGTAIEPMQFGVATATQDQFSGILGIGFGQNMTIGYKNFVDQLQAQNLTATKSFSIALGSKQEAQGAIVFGGVDTSKFTGKLAPVPIIPAQESPDGVARYWVMLESIMHQSAVIKDSRLPVILDTGTTLSLLPKPIVNDMAAQLQSPGVDARGLHMIDCAKTHDEGSFDFVFGATTIRVPYHEMIRKIDASPLGPEQCYLGVMEGNNLALLGDTFLRSAYTVFDLEANMTHMAQYANCGSSPRTIAQSSDFDGIEGLCSASDSIAAQDDRQGAIEIQGEAAPGNGGGQDGKEDGSEDSKGDRDTEVQSAAVRGGAAGVWRVAAGALAASVSWALL